MKTKRIGAVFMKKKFSRDIAVLLLTHVGGNLLMAAVWRFLADDFIFFYSHIISTVFMVLSVFFLHKRWTYIVNIILLIPTYFSGFTLAVSMAVMMFVPGGFIILTFGIINLITLFNEDVRKYFGFKPKYLRK